MSKQDTNEFINPILQRNEKKTAHLYKPAMQEFGYEIPLEFKVYNQVRYFEEEGKLDIDMNVKGVDAMARQFGVTRKQILKAYDNLTNKRKLGRWVIHEDPIYRRVTRNWVSNVRLRNGMSMAKLLQQRSTTPPAEEFEPPLLEQGSD